MPTPIKFNGPISSRTFGRYRSRIKDVAVQIAVNHINHFMESEVDCEAMFASGKTQAAAVAHVLQHVAAKLIDEHTVDMLIGMYKSDPKVDI